MSLTVREPAAPTAAEHAPEVLGFDTLRWSYPLDDGGAPITSFVVTPHRGDLALPPISAPLRSVLDLDEHLPRGTYSFTVAAVNRIGVGAPSPRSAPSDIHVAPSPPTGVSVTRGDRRATVSWTAAVDGGRPLARYRVEGLDGLGTVITSAQVPPTQTTVTITGLVPGWTYRFRVVASDGYLDGRPSALTPVVVAATLPGAAGSPRARPGPATARRRSLARRPPRTVRPSPPTGSPRS